MVMEHPAAVVDPSNPEEITKAMVPYYPEDSKMARYLKYRFSGFSVKESCGLANVTHKTVLVWRKTDERFRQLDTSDLEEIRRSMSAKYLNTEFIRNFALFLEKDFKLLIKDKICPDELSPQDRIYLTKIRSFYSPQQLETMSLLAEDVQKAPDQQNFGQLVFTLQRERESLTITQNR